MIGGGIIGIPCKYVEEVLPTRKVIAVYLKYYHGI